MARGLTLYKVTIPEDSAYGSTIYDCDPVTGETKNEQVAIWFGPRAIGMVYVDQTDWTDAALGLDVSYKRSSTQADYLPLLNENGSYDEGGTAPTVVDAIPTDAKAAFFLPARWCGAGWGRLRSVDASDGSDVAQTGGDKVIYVLIKD